MHRSSYDVFQYLHLHSITCKPQVVRQSFNVSDELFRVFALGMPRTQHIDCLVHLFSHQ